MYKFLSAKGLTFAGAALETKCSKKTISWGVNVHPVPESCKPSVTCKHTGKNGTAGSLPTKKGKVDRKISFSKGGGGRDFSGFSRFRGIGLVVSFQHFPYTWIQHFIY